MGRWLSRIFQREALRCPSVSIAEVHDALGEIVRIRGRVNARPTLAPLSRMPCAAWWCWVFELRQDEAPVFIGAATHGEFTIVDGTGRLDVSASQCRYSTPAASKVVIAREHWSTMPEDSGIKDLAEICRASGIDEPESREALEFREAILPLATLVEAEGVIVPGPEALGRLYREACSGSATLGPKDGGFIELSPI